MKYLKTLTTLVLVTLLVPALAMADPWQITRSGQQAHFGDDVYVEGNLETADDMTFAGDVLPKTDGTYDLGSSSAEWQDLFVDGTAKVDTLTVDVGPTTVSAGGIDITAGDLTITTGTVIQTEKLKVAAAEGRAGATASVGFVNTGTDNMAVTLAQSATADTWVIPITGLNTGDTVTAFSVHAQVESAGNTVTIDADLRKMTAVAADPTDASVGAITQVSVTADTKVDQEKTGLSETLNADEFLYVLVTVTTAASTDVQLLGVELTVTKGDE